MITEGYLARHSMGRSGMRGSALLDVAQDYALFHLYGSGLFDLGAVLKGGTSLRKFRAGNSGRFSTDLDFAVPDVDAGELLLDALDGAELHGVAFRLSERSSLRARLHVHTPLGQPDIPARVELTPRPLWLPCEPRRAIALPVHEGYEFEIPRLPVPALEEVIAEKLAAWRRRRKMRDLYDLYWLGSGALDEALVRRLTVLKIWHDVIDDRLGHPPFDPSVLMEAFDAASLQSEAIGLLTQPVEPERWANAVRERYRFIADLGADELGIARCDPRDRQAVDTLVEALTA